MMTSSDKLTIGYDYDAWHGYGDRVPITMDTSDDTNIHTIIAGMSGSGKSYTLFQYLANLSIHDGNDSICYFADFKQDKLFSCIRECPRYYPYDRTVEALEIVYDIMHKRQSGEDKSRHFVTLVWDEYMANILSLQGINKKKADDVMRKISEILMLGRSLSIRLIISCQRPDAKAFPTGSRLNYGVIIIVGSSIRSTYEMLMPQEYIDHIGDRKFDIGEGVVLLQSSQMYYVKMPTVLNYEKMQQVCIDVLTR